MIEIILTQEQKAAIVKEYGELSYLQTYCENLANHIANKQISEYKQAKLVVLAAAEDAEIDALYNKVLAQKEAEEAKQLAEKQDFINTQIK